MFNPFNKPKPVKPTAKKVSPDEIAFRKRIAEEQDRIYALKKRGLIWFRVKYYVERSGPYDSEVRREERTLKGIVDLKRPDDEKCRYFRVTKTRSVAIPRKQIISVDEIKPIES